MPFQDEAVPFDVWPQGPVTYADSMGQHHGTYVVLHPELVADGGAGPQYGASVPDPYAPHPQDPIIYGMDSIRQQHSFAVPLDPKLQAPFMWVEGKSLPHGTSVSFNPYLQAPLVAMDSTGLQHGTSVPFNPVPVPGYEPLQFIGNSQLQWTEELATGLSSTGLIKPSPVAELLVQLKQQETKDPTEVVRTGPIHCAYK